jgi:hypothetical protein
MIQGVGFLDLGTRFVSLWYRTADRSKLGLRGSKLSIKLSIARLTSMAGGTGASSCFWLERLISAEAVGEVIWEQGPFSKLRVILVRN